MFSNLLMLGSQAADKVHSVGSSTIAAVVGVTYALIAIIDKAVTHIIAKNKQKENEEKSVLTHHEQEMLSELYKMHIKEDSDGMPLWYTPRSWGDTQKVIAEVQRDTAETLRASNRVLERLEKKLEKIEDKVTKLV